MNLKSTMWLIILVTFSQVTIAGGDANVVMIKDYSFNPQEITIKRGQTIRWENNEKIQYHSVWFEDWVKKSLIIFSLKNPTSGNSRKQVVFPTAVVRIPR